jgi:hypothetical protein
MDIPDIITLLQNKLSAIVERKRVASQNGDIDQLAALEADEAQTNGTLATLQTLV